MPSPHTKSRCRHKSRVTIWRICTVGLEFFKFLFEFKLIWLILFQQLERNTNVLIYVKRRLGMCARKLGKLKEAAKIFRDVCI